MCLRGNSCWTKYCSVILSMNCELLMSFFWSYMLFLKLKQHHGLIQNNYSRICRSVQMVKFFTIRTLCFSFNFQGTLGASAFAIYVIQVQTPLGSYHRHLGSLYARFQTWATRRRTLCFIFKEHSLGAFAWLQHSVPLIICGLWYTATNSFQLLS